MIEVKPLPIELHEQATDLYVAAFRDDPVINWFFHAEGDQKAARVKEMFWFSLHVRFEMDEDILAAFEGEELLGCSALRLPDTDQSPELEKKAEEIWEDYGKDAHEQTFVNFGKYTDLQKECVPAHDHVYLVALAVKPEAQGKGAGRALIEATSEVAERHPTANSVVLDTENPKNVSIYEHCGYQVIAEGKLDEIPVWFLERTESKMNDPILTAALAQEILKAAPGNLQLSLDLGLSKQTIVRKTSGVELPNGSFLNEKHLKKISKKERKCFVVSKQSELSEIRVFSETTGWVRALSPTSGAPTTLVSGFPMHRIKDTDPWADTKAKVATLKGLKGRVLDTATGLGYTAIQLSQQFDKVLTVELDPAATKIARQNPWSDALFNSENIEQVIADVFEFLQSCSHQEFDAIVHDPPTIQFAGELYSELFYKECRRVLKRTGAMFHYIGDPESSLGSKVTEGVIRRLKAAGFAQVVRTPEAFGVVAR